MAVLPHSDDVAVGSFLEYPFFTQLFIVANASKRISFDMLQLGHACDRISRRERNLARVWWGRSPSNALLPIMTTPYLCTIRKTRIRSGPRCSIRTSNMRASPTILLGHMRFLNRTGICQPLRICTRVLYRKGKVSGLAENR